MKVTMNVPDDLLAQADAYAKANFQTRTGLFCFAVRQFLMSQQLPVVLENMNEAMQKIASTGQLDEETNLALEKFETYAQMLQLK